LSCVLLYIVYIYSSAQQNGGVSPENLFVYRDPNPLSLEYKIGLREQ